MHLRTATLSAGTALDKLDKGLNLPRAAFGGMCRKAAVGHLTEVSNVG